MAAKKDKYGNPMRGRKKCRCGMHNIEDGDRFNEGRLHLIRLNYDNPAVAVKRLIQKELSLRKKENIRKKKMFKRMEETSSALKLF